jgi:PAS domain S-box-containing protein
MLTGRAPFDGERPVDVIDGHRRKPVPLPSVVRPDLGIPPSVEAIVLRALAKDREARQRSMAELESALRTARVELGSRPEHPAAIERAAAPQAGTEVLAEAIADHVPSGLLLVDRATREILLFNRAMERLTGLVASSVVGRRAEELLSLLDGVPASEFLEQIRIQGDVGLRKLRVGVAAAGERTVLVQGHGVDVERAGGGAGTLFVVDDISDRESMCEAVRRRLPRDLAERILSGPAEVQPSGEVRRMSVLAVSSRGLPEDPGRTSTDEWIELLSDFVRLVAEGVLPHGGSIERVAADHALVTFPTGSGEARAGRAAIDVARQLAAVNERRQDEHRRRIELGIGLADGELLLLDVGGAARMERIVLGPAIHAAEALAHAAEGGEILATETSAQGLPEAEPAAVRIAIASAGSVSAWRVPYDCESLPEPITTKREIGT